MRTHLGCWVVILLRIPHWTANCPLLHHKRFSIFGLRTNIDPANVYCCSILKLLLLSLLLGFLACGWFISVENYPLLIIFYFYSWNPLTDKTSQRRLFIIFTNQNTVRSSMQDIMIAGKIPLINHKTVSSRNHFLVDVRVLPRHCDIQTTSTVE